MPAGMWKALSSTPHVRIIMTIIIINMKQRNRKICKKENRFGTQMYFFADPALSQEFFSLGNTA